MKNPRMIHRLTLEAHKIRAVFTHPTFIFLTLLGNSLLLICTTALYLLEKGVNPHIHNYFDSLWWGIATITTVAYGDVVPVTFLGRLVGIVLIYSGTILFVTFTGVLLGFVMKGEVEREVHPLELEMKREEQEQVRMEGLLKDIQKRLLIIEESVNNEKNEKN